MTELINKITPQQYEYKVSNEYGEFSYFWSFCSYSRGEKYVKLVLNIDLEGYTDEVLKDFKTYLDYPELAMILDKIVVDYSGLILSDVAAGFGFIFWEKAEMFKFIFDVSKRMAYAGITPFNGLDRCSAFPSIEYATDMLTYLLNEDCSLLEVEKHMAKSAGITGYYDEICEFMELPCVSCQKFDAARDTDLSYFFQKWDEYLAGVSEKQEISSKINTECLKRLQRNNKPNLPVAEEVSNAYNNFQSLWM